MEMKARMPPPPTLDLLFFVGGGGIVIDDAVDGQVLRRVAVDGFEESQKLLMTVALHALADDLTLAHAALLPDERQASAVAFLRQAVAHYQRFGVRVQRIMTDNGPCFLSDAFAAACRLLGLKHITTRPYTPKTNGKAERFIPSSLREWAYASSFDTSAHRADQLPRWLHRYNWYRPHSSLGLKTPVSRLHLSKNNLLTLHS